MDFESVSVSDQLLSASLSLQDQSEEFVQTASATAIQRADNIGGQAFPHNMDPAEQHFSQQQLQQQSCIQSEPHGSGYLMAPSEQQQQQLRRPQSVIYMDDYVDSANNQYANEQNRYQTLNTSSLWNEDLCAVGMPAAPRMNEEMIGSGMPVVVSQVNEEIGVAGMPLCNTVNRYDVMLGRRATGGQQFSYASQGKPRGRGRGRGLRGLCRGGPIFLRRVGCGEVTAHSEYPVAKGLTRYHSLHRVGRMPKNNAAVHSTNNIYIPARPSLQSNVNMSVLPRPPHPPVSSALTKVLPPAISSNIAQVDSFGCATDADDNQANERMDAYIEKFSGEKPFIDEMTVDMSQRPSSLQEAIAKYIDFIISENERRTRISECYNLPSDISPEFHKEAYYREVMSKPISFPTPKFRSWLKLYNVDIEITDPEGHTIAETTFPPTMRPPDDTETPKVMAMPCPPRPCNRQVKPLLPVAMATNLPALMNAAVRGKQRFRSNGVPRVTTGCFLPPSSIRAAPAVMFPTIRASAIPMNATVLPLNLSAAQRLGMMDALYRDPRGYTVQRIPVLSGATTVAGQFVNPTAYRPSYPSPVMAFGRAQQDNGFMPYTYQQYLANLYSPSFGSGFSRMPVMPDMGGGYTYGGPGGYTSQNEGACDYTVFSAAEQSYGPAQVGGMNPNPGGMMYGNSSSNPAAEFRVNSSSVGSYNSSDGFVSQAKSVDRIRQDPASSVAQRYVTSSRQPYHYHSNTEVGQYNSESSTRSEGFFPCERSQCDMSGTQTQNFTTLDSSAFQQDSISVDDSSLDDTLIGQDSMQSDDGNVESEAAGITCNYASLGPAPNVSDQIVWSDRSDPLYSNSVVNHDTISSSEESVKQKTSLVEADGLSEGIEGSSDPLSLELSQTDSVLPVCESRLSLGDGYFFNSTYSIVADGNFPDSQSGGRYLDSQTDDVCLNSDLCERQHLSCAGRSAEERVKPVWTMNGALSNGMQLCGSLSASDFLASNDRGNVGDEACQLPGQVPGQLPGQVPGQVPVAPALSGVQGQNRQDLDENENWSYNDRNLVEGTEQELTSCPVQSAASSLMQDYNRSASTVSVEYLHPVTVARCKVEDLSKDVEYARFSVASTALTQGSLPAIEGGADLLEVGRARRRSSEDDRGMTA